MLEHPPSMVAAAALAVGAAWHTGAARGGVAKALEQITGESEKLPGAAWFRRFFYPCFSLSLVAAS